MCIHVGVHIFMFVGMYVHVSMCIHVGVHIFMFVGMYVHVSMCIYVGVHIFMFVGMYVHVSMFVSSFCKMFHIKTIQDTKNPCLCVYVYVSILRCGCLFLCVYMSIFI